MTMTMRAQMTLMNTSNQTTLTPIFDVLSFFHCIAQFWYPKIVQFFICEAIISKAITCSCFGISLVVMRPREPNSAVFAMPRFKALFAPFFPFSGVFWDHRLGVQHHRLVNFISTFVNHMRFLKASEPILIQMIRFILSTEKSSRHSCIVNIMCKYIRRAVELLLRSFCPVWFRWLNEITIVNFDK